MKDTLVIAGKSYESRLLIGTGKYRDFAQTRAAVEASDAEIVTVAIRRTNIGQNANEASLLDALPPSKFTYLPTDRKINPGPPAQRFMKPPLSHYIALAQRRTIGAYVASRAIIGKNHLAIYAPGAPWATDGLYEASPAPRVADSGDVRDGVVGQNGLGLPRWIMGRRPN